MPRNGNRAGFNFTGPLSGLGNSILQRFGVKTAERNFTNLAGEPGKAPAQEAHGIPYEVQAWLGARLPFAAFVTIVGFFTYMYHISPIMPWLLVFFSLDFAIIVCWPPKQIGTKRRSFWDWGPMYSWFFAVGMAVCCGLLNYGLLESWINTAFLREYKDVQPTADPMSVSDAGVLTFAKGTHLDTSASAGFKFWFYNYCAAPIVGNDPQAAPITFWAVGVGCCKSRGEFTCDSASDKSAISGMPLRPHNLGPEITSHYDHAIRMSAAANDLEVSKDHVFVVWHKDPKGVGKSTWWLATTIFLILTLIAMCAYCGCNSALIHIDTMQRRPGVPLP
jgi:hypothetical protein